MKKVCIFRVSGGREWYRIYRNYVFGVGTVYEVYVGRRHVAGIWRHVDFARAVEIAVSLAKLDVNLIEKGEDVK